MGFSLNGAEFTELRVQPGQDSDTPLNIFVRPNFDIKHY